MRPPFAPKAIPIEKLSSTVFDNKRRGMPRAGCDCEQCFGYCLVNKDEAMRASLRGTIGRPDGE